MNDNIRDVLFRAICAGKVPIGLPLKYRSMRGRPSHGRAPMEGSRKSSRLGGEREGDAAEGVDVEDADGMAS